MLQLPLNIQLDDSARFDNFYPGDNLQLLEKLQKLPQNVGEFYYLWGSAQGGKTHLAQALCSWFDENRLSAVYLPLADPNLSPPILQGMSQMSLICIDQLQFVEGHRDWEVALFDLYNEVKQLNHSLVIFSDKAPGQSAFKLADLKSRLSAMEIYRVESLNDQQKIALLKIRASKRGLDISNEVCSYILHRQSRSLGDLMQILEKIDQSSLALKRKVTIPLVKALFE